MKRTDLGWRSRVALLAGMMVLVPGCHHVIIDGGLEPTQTRYDEEWNLAFAAAIFPAKVAPPTGCEGYFSTVETRHSFLNVIVTSLTWGIISPMESRIECGVAGGPGMGGSADAGRGEATGADAPSTGGADSMPTASTGATNGGGSDASR